jgi:ATP-binding cassette subfamily B protein
VPDTLLVAQDPQGAAKAASAAQQRTLRRLAGYLLVRRGAAIASFLLLVLGNVLVLVPVVLVGVAINELIPNRDTDGLFRTSIAILASALGCWVALTVAGAILAGVAQDAMHRLRRDIFEHVQTLSLTFFDRQPIGDLMSRILNDVDTINQFLDKGLLQLLNSVVLLVLVVIVMVAISWQLTVAVALVVPFVLLLVNFMTSHAGPAFARLQERVGALNGLLEESITGDRTIKAYHVEESAAARVEAISEEVMREGSRANFLAATGLPMSQMLGNIDVALVALVGGWLSIRGITDVGTVASFFLLARLFTRPLTQIAQLLNLLLQAAAGGRRVFEILDEQPAIVDRAGATELARVDGRVEVEAVDFSYVPAKPILHDVTIVAEPGQKIGLCGPTGAGKSTIINVITRYYDVAAGDIRLDGSSIYGVRQADLRDQVAMVLQEPYLFSDTVTANIRYARLDATDEEVAAAAKAAGAHGFISRLADGYDTVLEGGGEALSQGQRQLITIARVFLADRPIVILDEATSSVDTRTERKIQEALVALMKGRTSFVIAHRLSTIRDSDVIVAIDHGRVMDAGPHDVLMAKGGFYHDLYMSQFRDSNPGPTAPPAATGADQPA